MNSAEAELSDQQFNMADDDEVDILGDFSLDNLFPKEDGRLSSCYDGGVLESHGTDLLHCDYNMSSNWLLDTTQPWYSMAEDNKSLQSDDRQQHNFSTSMSTVDPLPTSSCIEENDQWNVKEKDLLQKGLELFGRSWVRLAQFIGSKTSQQVKSYMRTQHNSQLEKANLSFSIDSGHCESESYSFSELINDMEIPASMEEVIAVVSTAQTTIPVVSSKKTTTSYVNADTTDFRSVDGSYEPDDYEQERAKKKGLRRREVVKKVLATKRKRPRGRPCGKSNSGHSTTPARWYINKMAESSEEESLTMAGCKKGVLLSTGEEVVRLQKESTSDLDEDEEIEIDDTDENYASIKKELCLTSSQPLKAEVDSVTDTYKTLENIPSCDIVNGDDLKYTSYSNIKFEHAVKEEIETENLIMPYNHSVSCTNDTKEEDEFESKVFDTNSIMCSQSDTDNPFNLPVPTEEHLIDPEVNLVSIPALDNISVTLTYSQQAQNREPTAREQSTRMDIRNHIIESWSQSKPMYVTKTSVRLGLKNCGDVNCIGRVHSYLEQIGAINFGCEQVRYIRPLFFSPNSATVVSQPPVKDKPSMAQLMAIKQARTEGMRQRKKKNCLDFWDPLDGEGGYTTKHSADGRVVDTIIVTEDKPRVEKLRSQKAELIKLIYCNKFSDDKPAPFSVELHVEALLVMDLHSHAFHSEVIGLLGGRYYEEGAVLRITRSQPCKSNSSGVHCDMCPVSQTEASEKLHAEDLEVVGWYHSHPKFFPNPSVQDLDTQSNMQSWLCKSSVAFVSFIISPYCPTSRTLASEYRCMIVEKNEDAGSLGTPFRLKVDVVSYGLSITTFMKQMAQIFSLSENSNMGVVDFSSLYSSNLSYTDKKFSILSTMRLVTTHLMDTSTVSQVMSM
uniref:Myb-like, SWIRM and MPN domain-containing protein 1 n=1 Tax=Timema shepardi TaxID=629360 RepID=A0A7R9FYN2_TIMSH|nr:unnamed protein product [Timema shepardi]